MTSSPPAFPYKPGYAMQLIEHHPPAPFGLRDYDRSNRHEPRPEHWCKTTPQVQQVLENPPRETQWPSRAPPRKAKLTIRETIAAEDTRHARLFVCDVQFSDPKPHRVVAKIYDPLYYPPLGTIVGRFDVVWQADMDYSREAAAYNHLEATKKLQLPGFAPRYYGSWTFELPVTGNRRRAVRLILIEYLAGPSVLSLYKPNPSNRHEGYSAYHLEEAYRLNIITKILEGVVKQRHSGLRQNDTAPRNVMLVPGPQDTGSPGSLPRVVLVDYNLSDVFEHTKFGRLSFQDLPRPENPVEIFWDDGLIEFEGWLPLKWCEYYRRRDSRAYLVDYRKWLLATFGGVRAVDFAPIPESMRVAKYDEGTPFRFIGE